MSEIECAESRVAPEELPKRKLEMSFGGCGFMGVYHAGVGKCVCDHAPHLFSEFTSFYGASAGAITAVSAACRSDPMAAYKWVKKTFEASRKHRLGFFHPTFDLYKRLRAFLEEFLPRNAHKLCRNKVKISLTTLDDRGLPVNWQVSDFNTRKELINAIIASSFIPGYAGLKDLPKFRGKRCCDGGFSSNLPCASDPDVITVSPYSGSADISPQESCYPWTFTVCDQRIEFTGENLYRFAKSLCPTSWEELELIFHRGYEDSKRFFIKEGFITAPRPTPPISPPVPAPSEYFSVLSQSTNKSLAIAVSADFFSCQDEDEPELELPLRRRPSFIFFDVPRKSVFTSIIHSPVAAAKLSMRKFLQMLSSVSPTKLTAALQKKQHHIQHLATRDGQVLESHAGLVESLLHTITSVWVTL